MGSKSQFPALALGIGLVLIALALLNANKIVEGLVLGVAALLAVRFWARRSADAYLARLHAEHGDHMD
jgi:hypothetical protein